MSTFPRKHAEMALDFWVAYLRPTSAPFPPEMRQLMLIDLLLIRKLGTEQEIEFAPEQIMREASDTP